MNFGHLSKIAPMALSQAILFGVAGAFLMGFMVVNTVTSTTLGSGTVKMATETFADDADISIVKKGRVRTSKSRFYWRVVPPDSLVSNS